MKKVIQVQGDGTWEKDGKTYYRFQYELDDNSVIQVSHISETPKFAVGTEVEVEVRGSRNGIPYGALKRPGGSFQAKPTGGNGKHGREVGIQWAINAAITYCNANMVEVNPEAVKTTALGLLRMRDSINETYEG